MHSVQINSNVSGNHSTLQNESAVRPIEVINTREQKEDVSFNITDFIKSLLPSGISKPEEPTDPLRSQLQTMEPLQPPPMPPIFTTNDAFLVNWKSDWGQTETTDVGTWNHEPPSQNWNVPTQIQDSWIEAPPSLNADTPESPPLYEKKGVSQPVEYDDSLPTVITLF